MEIQINPLGAGQEIGRSCIIVNIKGIKIMFDCGVHMGYTDERKYPDFKRLISKYKKSEDNKNKNIKTEKNDYSEVVDLLIISHFHLDHCGALPYFTEILGYKNPILCSQPTKAILPVTLEDFRKVMGEYKGQNSILSPDQIKLCVNKIKTIELNETKIFKKNIKVTCFYAGHVLGASMFHIDIDGYTICYTGDYNTIIDRHLNGAYMPKLYPDILMTETTYGDKVRDTKRIREREFLKKIQEIIDKKGKVLIPIFALGRAQELCIILDTYWKRNNLDVPIYFLGPMAQKANFYYKIFQNWMNSTVKNLFIKNNVFDFKFIKQGDKVLMGGDRPMIIFATPGMLHGGLSLSIFKDHIAHDKKNCVIIPGYCSMGTVGNRIISGEKKLEIDNEIVIVNCEVYYMSFSAHADAKGLLQLIKNIQPKNIILVHGEYEIMKKFKSTCIGKRIKNDIIMPANNEEIDFKKFNLIRHININKDVFDVIKCLFYLKKEYESKNVNICLFNLGILYNEDIKQRFLVMNKIDLFNGKRIKSVVNNKICYTCYNRNILEIFIKFLVLYYSKIAKYYFELVDNKKKLNVEFIEGDTNKIIFSFKSCSDEFDDILDTKKIYKIIQIFQKINNLSK